MIFIGDENFPIHANAMLEAFDRQHQIRPITDYFNKSTDDVVWIPGLAKWNPKPVIISGDNRILRNKVERQALREAKLMWISLRGWQNIPWEIYGWKIIKVWPDIRDSATRTIRPTIFEVSFSTLKVEKIEES